MAVATREASTDAASRARLSRLDAPADSRRAHRLASGTGQQCLRASRTSCEAHFERAVPKKRIKKEAREERSAALAEMMRQAASLGPLLEKRRKAIEARLAAGMASRIGYRNERV